MSSEKVIPGKFEDDFPSEIEVEPGKIAKYDPKRACWIYTDDEGNEVAVLI